MKRQRLADPAEAEAAPDQQGADGTRSRNEAHRDLVAARLAEQLRHGALDAALTDLASIARACDEAGVEFAMFGALDELMAGMEQDADLGAVVATEEGGEGGSAAEGQLLTLVGRYCQLWERPALALGHFRAALEAGVGGVAAQLGHAQCTAVLGQRAEAFGECVRWWAAESPTSPRQLLAPAAAAPPTALVQFVFLLAELAAEHPAPPRAQTTVVLTALAPCLGSAANFALEPLARRWLPPLLLDPSGAEGELPMAFVLRALRHSRAFGSLELEATACSLRHRLLLRLDGWVTGSESGQGAVAGAADQLQLAASVACHEAFCGWASSPPKDDAALLRKHRARVASLGDAAVEGACADLCSVLAVAMHGQLCSHVEGWWQRVRDQPTLAGKWLSTPDLAAVQEAVDLVIERLLAEPRREQEIGASLRALRPAEGRSSQGEVEAFYSGMVYPPWHACEAVGLSPLPIAARMRQQDPSFTWAHGIAGGRPRHRVLIAGCGSGHQLALSQTLFRGVHLIGLDLSRRALGYASRRLEEEEELQPSASTTMELVAGDIMDLSPERLASLWPAQDASPLFEMVCCGGVLHHLPDPPSGLAALASVLRPGGVLQLATYSTLGTADWRAAAGAYLPSSASVGHLYPGDSAAREMRSPQRPPSEEELRAFRAELLALADSGSGEPSTAGERLAAHVVNCAEFFSAAGTRDLLFHPQERTYTLLELGGLLGGAGLECFGVTFGSLSADVAARRAYAAVHGAAEPGPGDEGRGALLERWHAVELAQPGIFGRMHRLNCRAI